MAHQLAPDLLQELFALRDRIAAAPHGSATELVHRFASLIGKNPSTVYTWLRNYAGYRTGRKKRRRGHHGAAQTLHFIAAAKREGIRGNSKATLPTAVAMNIAHTNGIDVTVSEGRVNALLRAARMDAKAQAAARNHITLRSLHPNHLHQIDPSLCLIYYTPKGQAIMRDEEFYKNKPASMDKVRLKVWRYVRYDHASGTIDVRYFEAAGENQHSLFEFLLYTWGQQSGRMSHGVPKMLLWDKGSANTSFAIKNLLDALGVDHETHATGHSWGKGGVEQGNNLVETHFESRLRFEPVESVEQLNASASRWVRDFNANAIEKVDCRLVRASGQPMVRDDLWQLIMRHPGALVQMPPREVCQWFMAGQELTRQVRNLKITFAHPELGRRASYDLNPWAEFLGNGQKVRVTPLLMQQGALRIEIDRLGAEPCWCKWSRSASSTNTGGPCPRRSRARICTRPADRQREGCEHAGRCCLGRWHHGGRGREEARRAGLSLRPPQRWQGAWWRTAISARPTCRAAWYPTLGRCRRPRCSSSRARPPRCRSCSPCPRPCAPSRSASATWPLPTLQPGQGRVPGRQRAAGMGRPVERRAGRHRHARRQRG